MLAPTRHVPVASAAMAAVLVVFAAAGAAAPAARTLGGKKLVRVSAVERWCEKWSAPYAAEAKAFDDACKRLPEARAATECADPPGEPECGPATDVAGHEMASPPSPWRAAYLVATKAGVYRKRTCHLALETDAGVFLRLGAAGCGADPESGAVWDLESLAFETYAGDPSAAPVLVWRFRATAIDEKRITALLLCGMGKSKRPTCDSAAIEKSVWDPAAKTWTLLWRLLPRFEPGSLTLDPDPAAPPLPPEEAARVGTWRLRFP